MNLKLKNFTVDKFNNDVNNSGNIEDKYKNWTQYRHEISGFIKKAVDAGKDIKTIIIFGAGELNDIDLHFLCDISEKIVLTDVDTKSIEDGLCRQKINDLQKSKIEIIQADYTGAAKAGFFREIETLTQKLTSVQDICTYIETALREFDTNNVLHEYENQFDLVISCPVYTQLIYTQMEVFLKALFEYGLYEYNALNKMLNATYQNMYYVIENYNNLLLSTSKDDGLIFVMTDIIEMYKGDKNIKQIKKAISNEPIDTDFLEKKVNKHGIDFSILGKQDMLSKINTVNKFWTIWSFDESKEYLVNGFFGIKKNLIRLSNL